LRRQSKESGSTEGRRIDDEYEDDDFADDFEIKIPTHRPEKRKSLYDGYVVDSRGRIRGEARRYDPYAKFGEIMLYEIDVFGFVLGYVSNSWKIMSEQDLLSDRHLARRLREAKYQVWKRHNILELNQTYERLYTERGADFERYCRYLYMKSN